MKDNESSLNEDNNVTDNVESESVDTSIIDEQWNNLSQDWQSQPIEKTDIQALLKQTKRRTVWAKTCLGLNVIATVGLFISFVYGIFQGEFGSPWNIYLGGGGFMSLIFVYYEVKIRAKTWSQISDSPDKAIENALAGCESSMKYMSLTKWSCLPFAILANWFVYSIGQQDNKPVLGAFIFINVFIVVMYLITELIHRKRKREFIVLTHKISNL
jgi:hypothetical protein